MNQPLTPYDTYAAQRKLRPYRDSVGREYDAGHIYNQSDHLRVDQGTCLAHAAANCLEIQAGRLLIAPDLLYERTKEIAADNGWKEATASGASMDAVALALRELAIVRDVVRLKGTIQMLSFLANTGPFVMGLRWTEEMQFAPGYGARRYLPPPSTYSIPMGNHAVAAIALGDYLTEASKPRWFWSGKKPQERAEHLVVENSHGMRWGNKGRALLAVTDVPIVCWGAMGIVLK